MPLKKQYKQQLQESVRSASCIIILYGSIRSKRRQR